EYISFKHPLGTVIFICPGINFSCAPFSGDYFKGRIQLRSAILVIMRHPSLFQEKRPHEVF
ncbi:MAG: hypothetical protein ACXV8S_12710, partial [Methylobacter sp.]